MANLISIGQKPAEGLSASEPEPPVGQAPADGVLVTERAVNQIRDALAKENIPADKGGMRLGVKGGGCSGLSYAMNFDTQSREGDRIFVFDGVRVFIDPKSFEYLRGVTLDYENTLLRQGFSFNNPNSTRSCGCGSSFSV